MFLLVFQEKRIWHFKQFSLGDNLHEVSDPIFWEKYKEITISMSSTDFVGSPWHDKC